MNAILSRCCALDLNGKRCHQRRDVQFVSYFGQRDSNLGAEDYVLVALCKRHRGSKKPAFGVRR